MNALLRFVALGCTLVASAQALADGYRADYRNWDLRDGNFLPFGHRLIEVNGEQVILEREGFGEKVTRPLNEFADHEIRLIKLWQDPIKRRAAERALYLGGLQVTPDNEVEIHIGNWRVTDADIRLFAESFPELRVLSLSHCQLSREGLEPLVRLQRLRKLTLPLVTGKNDGVANIEVDLGQRAEKNDDGDRSIDPGFDIIARIESLEEFAFEGNGSHSIGDHLTAFAKTKLRRLELSHARLSASGLQRIAQIASLEELSLDISPVSTGIQPPLLKHLRGMKQLRALDMGSATLTDDDAGHISNFPKLRELHIGGWTKQGFRELSKVQTLETLRVLDSFKATCGDRDVAEIAKLTQLMRLWLASRDITDDGLAHVAKLKQLEELNLPESITPDGLKHLTGLTNLRKLSFRNIFIDEAKNPVRLSHALDLLINRQQRGLREALHMLDDSLPLEGKLTKLSWSNIPEIDLPALKYLAQSDDIEAFSVEYEPVADWLAGLSAQKNIKDLSILGNERLDRGQPAILTVTPEALQHIKDWKNLRSLHFQRCKFNERAFEPLAKLQLTSLSMSECRLATDSTADISKLRSLKELSLHSEDYDFGERDLHALGQLENLETLHVSGPLSLTELAHLRGLKHLRELRFGRGELQFSDVLNLFTKDSLRSPAAATTMLLEAERKSDGSVVELKLERLTFTDNDLRMLKDFPSLQNLELPPEISDKGLSHVAELSHLKVLRINSKQVTDGGIPHLLRLSKLEGLYIDAAQITDDGLKELVKLPRLDYLLLANTRVNKKTAEEIESKRNGLTIVVH